MPLGESVGTAYVRLLADGSGLDESIRKELAKSDGTVEDAGERHGGIYSEGFKNGSADHDFLADLDKKLKEVDKTVTKGARSNRNWSDSLGKLFGKGSRNDFVNGTGSMVEGVAHLTERFIRAIPKITQFGTTLFQNTKFILGGIGNIRDLGGVMEELGKQIVPLLSKAGPASIGVLGASLVILSSSASLATGALVAGSGTVGMGLIGALGLLGATVVPLGFGIAGLVVAFTNLTDAEKKALAVDLKPLTDAFHDLADIASRNIFGGLGKELSSVAPTVKTLAPVMDSITRAVRDQIDAWVDLVNSGGFTTFFETVNRDVPGQIGSIGKIGRNLTTGLTGLFNGLSPVLSDFLDDLSDITGQFSKWVNSARGNQAVKDFFDDALSSAEALGRAALNATIFLGDLFRAGAKYGGDALFQDLADQFKAWGDWLTDPKNQDSIQQWVSDGADFARTVGDIVVEVGKLIAVFDQPAIRFGITTTLGSIATGAKLTADALKLLTAGSVASSISEKFFGGKSPQSTTDAFGDFFDGFAEGAGDIVKGMKRITKEGPAKVLASLREKLADLRTEARASASKFITLGDSVNNAKVSLNGWLRELAKQNQALRDFTANAVDAANRGLRKGLIQALKDAGPEGALRMQQLANATDTQIGRANRIWAAGRKAIQDYARLTVPAKKITVDTKDAENDVDNLQSKIGGIHDKTVTVTVNLAVERLNAAAQKVFDGVSFGSGGITTGPTRALVGEAGPEAIVPLNRPLSMVDPSVRALSAFAQGLSSPDGAVARVESPTTVNNLYITAPTADPRAVALTTLNYLTAQAY